VAGWFWYAVVAAILYGAHQIFTKLAADRIGEGLGGFVVEATAALSILVYLAFLWLASRWNQQSSAQGIFFCCFRRAVRFLLCRRFWPVAQRSWPSQECYFFANRHPGSGSSALRLQSQDCFCCADDLRRLGSARALAETKKVKSAGQRSPKKVAMATVPSPAGEARALR